jgi:hypothetical protein
MGAGMLLNSCSGKDKITPLRPLNELYQPELPDKAIDGKPLKANTRLTTCTRLNTWSLSIVFAKAN